MRSHNMQWQGKQYVVQLQYSANRGRHSIYIIVQALIIFPIHGKYWLLRDRSRRIHGTGNA